VGGLKELSNTPMRSLVPALEEEEEEEDEEGRCGQSGNALHVSCSTGVGLLSTAATIFCRASAPGTEGAAADIT
jgi:hypothetical protein